MIRQAVKSIYRHEKGTAAIEFAIAIPVLLLLIMGIVEFSLIMYGSVVLEGAVGYAAREGSTGYYPTNNKNGTQYTYIYTLLSEHVQGLLNPSKLRINIVDIGNYNQNNPAYCNPPKTKCTQNFGKGGDVVVYSVSYPWNIFTPFLQKMIGNNGIFLMTASMVVKNEPF